MKFRKKPVVIEAWKIPPTPQTIDVPVWLAAAVVDGSVKADRETGCVHIKTLEGEMVGNPGDWIIKGVKDELYPVKNDIFRQTYEAVDAA
jgi:hypothetical protein